MPPTPSAARSPFRARSLALIGGLVIVAAVIIGIAAFGGSSSAAPNGPGGALPGTSQPAGEPAPTVEIERFDGSAFTLAAYEGQPLVVNFWASWCPSCVAEMSAAFLPVQETLGAEVAFLGINLQDDRQRALDLVAETGVLFDLAEDPQGDLYTALGGLGMPFTVFIDADGSVLHRHNGPVTADQLTGLIEEFLQS